MELFHFLLWYLGTVAFVLFVVLFGETPIFRRTPISFCHWFITVAPIQSTEWLVVKCCGVRGKSCMACMDDKICKRRNPIMQILYLVIWAVCYHLYCTHLFPLLPGKYLGSYHIFTGSLAAFLCLGFFYLSSVSDPGTITNGNCGELVSLFPFDDAIFAVEKDCPSCGFVKPARSKHCSACERCVARFDHHCGWINNCVGLNNYRYFLGFLASNLLVSCYGSIAISLTLFGDVEDVLWEPITHPRSHRIIYLGSSPSILFEYLMLRFQVLLLLLLVSLVVGVLMISFLGFHLYLITAGKTTNEAFKWSDLQTALEHDQDEHQPVRRWGSRRPKILMPTNMYNKGFRKNFYEVLFPDGLSQDNSTQRKED